MLNLNNYKTQRGLGLAGAVALTLLGLILLVQREDVAVVIAHDAPHEAGIFSDASILTQWPRLQKDSTSGSGPVEVDVGEALGLLGTADSLNINNNKGMARRVQEADQPSGESLLPTLMKDLQAMRRDEKRFEKAVNKASRRSSNHPEGVDAFIDGARALQLMGATSRALDSKLKRTSQDAAASISDANKHAMRIALGTGASHGEPPPWASKQEKVERKRRTETDEGEVLRMPAVVMKLKNERIQQQNLMATTGGSKLTSTRTPQMPRVTGSKRTQSKRTQFKVSSVGESPIRLATTLDALTVPLSQNRVTHPLAPSHPLQAHEPSATFHRAQNPTETTQRQEMARQPSHEPQAYHRGTVGEDPLRLASSLDALTHTPPTTTSQTLTATGISARQMPMDVGHLTFPASYKLARSSQPRTRAVPLAAPPVKRILTREGEHEREREANPVFAREAAEKTELLPSERRAKKAYNDNEAQVGQWYTDSEDAERRADSEERAAKAREQKASLQADTQVAKQLAAHRAARVAWQQHFKRAVDTGSERGTKKANRRETAKAERKARKVAEARLDSEAAKARVREAKNIQTDAVAVEHQRLKRYRLKAEELVSKAAANRELKADPGVVPAEASPP